MVKKTFCDLCEKEIRDREEIRMIFEKQGGTHIPHTQEICEVCFDRIRGTIADCCQPRVNRLRSELNRNRS